ncbi:leucine-rich repeat domain-containing protein [Candidatus Uabimicrobium sp. HlEnr_7]|uniref:leucine-rich repeat domain-containing protein n=1 Tax=Candidatus Uabimicrobium helgolandensis TaxID=3095367 RepID=UPI0035577AD0
MPVVNLLNNLLTTININDIKDLLNIFPLSELDLSYNDISELPPELAQLQNLSKLYLSHNDIGEKQQSLVREWLPNCNLFLE